jgi:hypothetical protein
MEIHNLLSCNCGRCVAVIVNATHRIGIEIILVIMEFLGIYVNCVLIKIIDEYKVSIAS